MSARHTYLEHDGPIAFAHRGGTSAAPENSLRSFEHAVSLGYRYVETDVHASSDGVLLAFHDSNLKRTCGQDVTINSTPYTELSQARLEGTDPIPLLEDILGSWPQLRVNIDCKADSALQPLIDTVKRTNSLDRICIGSFSDNRLAKIRAVFGDSVCTSMGPREVARFVAAASLHIPLSAPREALAAQIPVKQGPISVVTPSSVALAHKWGLQVHVWTIDDPIEMARLLDLGVDGIMTDDTETLKRVFTERNLW
jgi:glycerophosphoryl diester phosphodiesterase